MYNILPSKYLPVYISALGPIDDSSFDAYQLS
jgi:hypothetical protein